MNNFIKILIASLLISLSIYSCKESKTSTSKTVEKEEVKVDTCGEITFAMVNTILVERCLGCHSGGSRAASGLDFEDKAVIMTTAKDGRLICALTGNGCKIMPPFGNELENNQVTLIQCWVQNGMK